MPAPGSASNSSPLDDIELGSEAMDGEHRVQIGLLRALREALTRGDSGTEIDSMLDLLLDYTKVHFASEQMLMRLHAYPGYDAHLAEHDDAVDKVQSLREAFRAGDTKITEETIEALSHWLADHIRRTDRALGFYLNRLDPGRA